MDGRSSAAFNHPATGFGSQLGIRCGHGYPTDTVRVAPRQRQARAMIETKRQHHYRLLFALAAAAGLGLGLALIAFCDAWYSGSGFSGMQVIDAHR